MTKTGLRDLLAFQPTHVIFDFIDDRFDLMSIGRSLISLSGELAASGYLDQPALQGARRVPRLSGGCERLWGEACGELAALFQATALSRATPILHSARWATKSRTAGKRAAPLGDVEVLPGEPARIQDHNALLGRYEAAFEMAMPGLVRIEAPRHRIADGDHQWGLSPFHYIPDYYAEIARQLTELGVLNGEA